MSLMFFLQFITEELISAISYTLVHSLWQGMLLAVLAGAILYFTRHKNSATRYNLLLIALLTFTVGVVATFCMHLSVFRATAVSNDLVNGNIPTQFSRVLDQRSLNVPITERVLDTFNGYAPWLVLAWLIVILYKSLQLTAGLLQARRLKTTGVKLPGESWEATMKLLCTKLGIPKVVQLLESQLVQVPAAVGFFKPVILVPAGMLTALSPGEVEAIILHELAHIRRKDYLVNIMQHFVEILFFFNPAVRWVSGLINAERENCCDDIAVTHTRNKKNYIKALVAFHEAGNQPTPSFIPAFAGEKNQLLTRVRRIIYNNNKTLNNMEKKFLAAGLIVTTVFIVAFTPGEPQQNATSTSQVVQHETPPATPHELVAQVKVVSDTVPAKAPGSGKGISGTINTTVDGKKYKITTKNDEVLDLYVDGEKVAPNKYGEHKAAVTRIIKQSKTDMDKAEKDMAQAQLDMAAAEKEIENAQKELAQASIELDKAQVEMEKDMELASKELAQSKDEMEQSKKEIAAAKIEIEQANIDMKRDLAEAKAEIELAKKEMENAKIEMSAARKDIEIAKKEMAEAKKIQEAIIADFVKDKIISSKAALNSYTLNADEFIVNGVKQSAELHKKYKTKYSKNKNWSINHNNE